MPSPSRVIEEGARERDQIGLARRDDLLGRAVAVTGTLTPHLYEIRQQALGDAKPGMGVFTLTTGANPKQRQALDLAAAIAV